MWSEQKYLFSKKTIAATEIIYIDCLKRHKKWVQSVKSFFASVVEHTSTLHGVVQWSKAFRALIKATPFVEVKAWLALGAEVFAETGLTVLYPAPWRGGEEEERLIRAGVTLSSGADWKLRGLGKGGSWKDYCMLSHPQQKSVMPLWFPPSGAWICVRMFVLPKWFFSDLFLLLFRVGSSTALKLNSLSSNKIVIWKWTRGLESVTGTTFCTKTKQRCRECSHCSTPHPATGGLTVLHLERNAR